MTPSNPKDIEDIVRKLIAPAAGYLGADDVREAIAALQTLLSEAERKARVEEIEALYARADKDPVLRDKLDNLYRLRYENLGGGNIFIKDRLESLEAGGEQRD